MLHPPIVSDEPHQISLACSDVYRLLALPKAGAAAPRKMLFYIASLPQLARTDWLRLEADVRKEVQKLKSETDDGDNHGIEPDRAALRIS